MNTTETTRVEIDERIRERPELLRAAHEATAYLLSEIEGVAPPAVIAWRFAPLDDGSIELSMTESDEYGAATACRTFPVGYLRDPSSRDGMALRTFGDLLRKRSKVNMARIDELIHKIDFDEYVRAYSEALKKAGTGN